MDNAKQQKLLEALAAVEQKREAVEAEAARIKKELEADERAEYAVTLLDVIEDASGMGWNDPELADMAYAGITVMRGIGRRTGKRWHELDPYAIDAEAAVRDRPMRADRARSKYAAYAAGKTPRKRAPKPASTATGATPATAPAVDPSSILAATKAAPSAPADGTPGEYVCAKCGKRFAPRGGYRGVEDCGNCGEPMAFEVAAK